MSKVTDWKVSVLTKVFSDVEGLVKVIAVNLLTGLKIGQLVLVNKVVSDTNAPVDLLAVIKGINAPADLDPALLKGIKGKGFMQAESLVNFADQLTDEKRLMLESLLGDKEGLKILKAGSSALLDDYLYIR